MSSGRDRCRHVDALAPQIGVYAALGIANSMNKYNVGIAVKIASSLATIFIFWDLKWVLAPFVLAVCGTIAY
jgi:hypothetical protein